MAMIRRDDTDYIDPTLVERHRWVRVLWLKVIIRAIFDFVLWRDSSDAKLRKWAHDADKWLFHDSLLNNSLDKICHFLEIDIQMVREAARRVTRDQVKKMEFIERQKRKDPTQAILAVIGISVEEDELEILDDGDGT